MEWKTSISTIRDNSVIIRGKGLAQIARDHSFAGNAYFILTGKAPSQNLELIFNIMLSLCIDHGIGNVSTMSARLAASSNVSLQQSLIAAIASFGHAHGAAAEDSARWFFDKVGSKVEPSTAVREAIQRKEKIAGYGHRILERDARVDFLFKKARDLDFFDKHCNFAQEVEKEIEKVKAKKIPLNIDGAIAALSLDLGIKPSLCTGLFILGRLPGLLAHIQEEKEQCNGIRGLEQNEITYEG